VLGLIVGLLLSLVAVAAAGADVSTARSVPVEALFAPHQVLPDPPAIAGSSDTATSTGTTPPANARTSAFLRYDAAEHISRVRTHIPGHFLATKGADEAVNLASSSRTRHILQGDRTGGGHLWPGRAGKTPFPHEWDADRVMHEISDIATDPAATVVGRQGRRTVLEGTRGAVRIRVVTDGRDIITGYPTNLPRNPR
jgi:hypothetical protein